MTCLELLYLGALIHISPRILKASRFFGEVGRSLFGYNSISLGIHHIDCQGVTLVLHMIYFLAASLCK